MWTSSFNRPETRAARHRKWLVWGALVLVLAVPLGVAAASPLLAWRQPVYIIGGFAGIAGLCLMLVQPLLALGALPGLSGATARRAHRVTGQALVAAIVLHVAALWITSPPDMLDALAFAAPTLFSTLGVLAMWLVLANGTLALLRKRLRLSPRRWRRLHLPAVVAIVGLSVGHAVLIQGTMGWWSKLALSALVIAAALAAFWRSLPRSPR